MLNFSDKDIELARSIKKLGEGKAPEPGDYFFDERQEGSWPADLQEGVYLVGEPNEFFERVGGSESFEKHLVWLPTWESGSEWLIKRKVSPKHIYYTVKEGVLFYDEEERELLYGEIIRILEIEAWEKSQEGNTA